MDTRAETDTLSSVASSVHYPHIQNEGHAQPPDLTHVTSDSNADTSTGIGVAHTSAITLDLTSSLTRSCSVRGCTEVLPGSAPNKMCDGCRGKHRIYANTKRAKRKMEKLALGGTVFDSIPSTPASMLVSAIGDIVGSDMSSLGGSSAQMLNNDPLKTGGSVTVWELNPIDPRLFSCQSSTLVGALTLSPPAQVINHDSPSTAPRPASPVPTAPPNPPAGTQLTPQEPAAIQTAHPKAESNSINDADESQIDVVLDPSRTCSVRNCHGGLPYVEVYPFKMCRPCRDRYRAYGCTKREKHRRVRVELQEKLAKGADPSHEAGLEANASGQQIDPDTGPVQMRMCTVSHCHVLLSTKYPYKRCEKHRVQNRWHSALKRVRWKESKVKRFADRGSNRWESAVVNNKVGVVPSFGATTNVIDFEDKSAPSPALTSEANPELTGNPDVETSTTDDLTITVQKSRTKKILQQHEKASHVCSRKACSNIMSPDDRYKVCDLCRMRDRMLRTWKVVNPAGERVGQGGVLSEGTINPAQVNHAARIEDTDDRPPMASLAPPIVVVHSSDTPPDSSTAAPSIEGAPPAVHVTEIEETQTPSDWCSSTPAITQTSATPLAETIASASTSTIAAPPPNPYLHLTQSGGQYHAPHQMPYYGYHYAPPTNPSPLTGTVTSHTISKGGAGKGKAGRPRKQSADALSGNTYGITPYGGVHWGAPPPYPYSYPYPPYPPSHGYPYGPPYMYQPPGQFPYPPPGGQSAYPRPPTPSSRPSASMPYPYPFPPPPPPLAPPDASSFSSTGHGVMYPVPPYAYQPLAGGTAGPSVPSALFERPPDPVRPPVGGQLLQGVVMNNKGNGKEGNPLEVNPLFKSYEPVNEKRKRRKLDPDAVAKWHAALAHTLPATLPTVQQSDTGADEAEVAAAVLASPALTISRKSEPPDIIGDPDPMMNIREEDLRSTAASNICFNKVCKRVPTKGTFCERCQRKIKKRQTGMKARFKLEPKKSVVMTG